MVRVREERERQIELGLELRLGRDRIGADTENDCIESLEPREGVAKLARLDRSPRGIGLGVEIENHALADLVGQAERLALIGEQREVRGCCSDLDHFLRGAGSGNETDSR
jgi:hypothetical protein